MKDIAKSYIARSPQKIGALIRNARKQKGMTQTELGNLTNLRQATISKIENGEGATRLDTFCDVLLALDLEISISDRSRGASQEIEDIF